MKPKNLLLASHGTPGARAAETAALDLLSKSTSLHHLLVVPDFWRGMMGDDWLNNAATQDRYGKYVEGQIGREIAEDLARVEAACETRAIRYSHTVVVGKPADCLIAEAAAGSFDMMVIGAPRPKGVPGLNCRLKPDVLLRALTLPLLVVPHPGPETP